MGGGAWPFLVGGVICLVNSVNERDLSLLNNVVNEYSLAAFLRGTWKYQLPGRVRQQQVCDALRCSGLHACYTEVVSAPFNTPLREELGQTFEPFS